MNNTQSINRNNLIAYAENRHKALLGDKTAQQRARIIFSAFTKEETLLWFRARCHCKDNESRALDMLMNPSTISDSFIEIR